MILDTGPINVLELAKYMQIMNDVGNDQSIIVHCFHTEIPVEMNMRSIPIYKQAFNSLVDDLRLITGMSRILLRFLWELFF